MASLTARQQSFIEFMKESDELARRGFDLLLKQAHFETLFDHLKDAGFFEPSHNPAPIEVDNGFFRVPYWSSLDYLVAVARVARSKDELALAEKVLAVVRSVTTWTDDEGNKRDNYHTYHKFAEILGLIPPAAITAEYLDLIPTWLTSQFDRNLVGDALAEGAVTILLSSHSSADWQKALEIFRHCTAVSWTDAAELGEAQRKPKMPIDGHWLSILVTNHAKDFGQKLGVLAANLLLNRTQEVFSSDGHRAFSSVYRPAVEEHKQNLSWQEPENACVQGLRDVLLGWCEQDLTAAKGFVTSLLSSPEQIVRRIAIFVTDRQWEDLGELFFSALSSEIFDWGHLHEVYNLLSRHFAKFTDPEKAATVKAIAELPPQIWADDPALALRYTQRRWLSAIAGQGYEPADRWYQALNGDPSIGELGEHPDFESYSEVSVGFGPSPYTVQELLALAETESIVEKLNAFEQPVHWKGLSSRRALVEALEDSARKSPEVFVRLLTAFLSAKHEFQYAVISGLKKAWDDGEKSFQLDWDVAWRRIVTFLERLLGDEAFWVEGATREHGGFSYRDWIPPLVAELLGAGTKDDNHSFPEELLQRTWELILVLLDRAHEVDQPESDAMSQAINSPKGKAIEALVNHALRSCRIADKATGTHSQSWGAMCSTFDSELSKCKGCNYEFSTLAGAYLANLLYLDREWVRINLARIFPEDHPINTLCALDGLAYSRANSAVYSVLVQGGVIDRALRMDLKRPVTGETLVERIAVAYLRGEESLDSPRFEYLFLTARHEWLEIIARFFWSVRREALSQEQRERVIEFWERCLEPTKGISPAGRLMSTLGRLSCYLETAKGRDLRLLLAVAPFVHVGHDAHEFFQEINRVMATNPEGVSQVLGCVLAANVPDFDYEDRLKTLIKSLAAEGRRADANRYAELARGVSGMQELYNQLTREE